MLKKLRKNLIKIVMLTVNEECRNDVEKDNLFTLIRYAIISKKMLKMFDNKE